MNLILSASIAGLVGLTATTTVQAANDATPFGAFEAVCLTPNAEFQSVKAAASAWHDTEVTGASTFPNATVTEKLSKAFKVGGVPVTLFAWTGTLKSGVRVCGCTVRVSKPAFGEIETAATAYAGFSPQDSDPKKAVFRYTPAAAKPTAIDKSGFDAAAASEGIDILTVSGDVHGAVIDLLKIKK